MVSAGVGSSVFFGAYSQILKVLGTTIDKTHDHPDYLKVGIASGFAGMVMPIIACPIEVIKVVLQSQIPVGVHKGKIPDGVHKGKVPHGVHKGKIPHGVHKGKVPHGVHKGKVPHGVHKGKIPHEVHKGKVPHGVHKHKVPHGVHKGKIPHGVHEGKVPHGVHKGNIKRGLGIMVLNTSFNNVSIISWQSVLLVEEIGVPGENH